jgi:hypothetical protein
MRAGAAVAYSPLLVVPPVLEVQVVVVRVVSPLEHQAQQIQVAAGALAVEIILALEAMAVQALSLSVARREVADECGNYAQR